MILVIVSGSLARGELRISALSFEERPRQSGLTNDAEQCTPAEWIVERNWDRNRSVGGALLKHAMAALLSHCVKIVLF
jgi:hypothetical protein